MYALLNVQNILQAPNNVIRYVITGDGESAKYFYINPATGEISLLQSVLETQQTVFRVSSLNSNYYR